MPQIQLGSGIKTGATIILVLAILATLSAGFYTIDGIERGVKLNWKNPEMVSIQPGWGLLIPYQQTIETYNIQTQKYVISVGSASKDLQSVQTEVALNWRLDPEKVAFVHIDLGHNAESIIIDPAIKDVVKRVTANYTASELVQKRELVRTEVENVLKERLRVKHIIVDNGGVSMTDFQYSDEFDAAVEAKNTATQLRDKAKTDLERINIEKAQKIAQSEADLKYATPDMIALKQIEVNKLAIERWNGILPQYVMGDGTNGIVPMINMAAKA